jgi:transcriptional repressor NF-X1
MFITCACQAQKQEIKCGASKSTEGNGGKVLPCNDECARLERNRRLAVALNIDQATHVDGGDHIPFSTETLNYFSQHVKWSQTQEREFRVFAASDDEKRLRFKPMQAPQRAFIHLLAEDFGLDTESIDPEPHRHVMVWKTPRFVSAPSKTLADALRIRQAAQRSVNTSANVSDNEGGNPSKSKSSQTQPFNGFVISKPRFGLTIDEVRAEVNAVTPNSPAFTFDIEFLPNEEVVLKAISRTLSPQDLERSLQSLRNTLATAIAGKGIGSMQLCTLDSSLNITRLESDSTGGDGWSRVAAKKAAPRISLQTPAFGASNSFAALTGATGKVTFAKKTPKTEKKRKEVELVVDDWEAAEMAEEEREEGGHGYVKSEGEEGASLNADQRTEVGVSEDAVTEPSHEQVPQVTPAQEANAEDVSEQLAGESVGQQTSELSGEQAANSEKLDWASEAEAST